MKTTKTTTTAYELGSGQLVVAGPDFYNNTFTVLTSDGVMQYTPVEMEECYKLTDVQLQNMRMQLAF